MARSGIRAVRSRNLLAGIFVPIDQVAIIKRKTLCRIKVGAVPGIVMLVEIPIHAKRAGNRL